MRHDFASLTISAGAIGMGEASTPRPLIAPSNCPQAVTAGRMSTGRTAIALSPIAMAAKQNLRATPLAQEKPSSSHRRRTFRSAVGIDRRSSTECANAIMMAHTVNQSAVLRDDSHVISQLPEGLDIELAW